MYPDEEMIADYEEDIQPTKTYKLDFESKRVTGYIDGIEAIKQCVQKVLLTERASFSIYGTDEGVDYGVELQRFIGKPYSFIAADIERTISEALLQDDRINAIDNFMLEEPTGDTLTISFTVSSIYGNVDITEEARIK